MAGKSKNRALPPTAALTGWPGALSDADLLDQAGASAAQRARTVAGNHDALKAFVQGRSAAVLAERLWAWAETDSDLMADLKAWAAQSQDSDDPEAMQAVISDLLTSHEFLDWRESGAYAARAGKVLPLLEKVLASDAVQARVLCEHALRRLYVAMEKADDSNGEIGDVVMSLMELLLRSLQAAPPPADWLDDWFDLMRADPWELWDEKAVLEAAGPAVLARYHQRAASDWQAWLTRQAKAQADAAAAIATTRSGTTGRTGRNAPQVAGAHETGRIDWDRRTLRNRYLNALKSRGDTQATLDLMRGNLADAAEHSELVAYCETLGQTREALQVAQAAARKYPSDWRCEKDLLRCYERDGCHDEALAIRRAQLEKSPTAEHYQAALKAARAAGRDPAAYRDALFAWAQGRETQQAVGARSYPWARATPGVAGRHVGVRVAWLLADGRLDEALALVQLPHVCQPELLRAIANKLPTSRNAQAVPLLLRVFALAMPQASTPYSDVLALVRDISTRMDPAQRGIWLASLRVEYKPKRNFIKGLDAMKGP